MRVPPSCTSTCQPADIAWNRPFKSYLRCEWVSMLRQQLCNHTGSTQAFKFKPPTRHTICKWVSSSWTKLSDATIKNGFFIGEHIFWIHCQLEKLNLTKFLFSPRLKVGCMSCA
ncbi:hypothetical protein JG687_00019110 [Phytophthora cactorum]|uniref:DDE-1 domain-containing protein n=1 Tax=Phytophthora cactorum TaxID=29920 RepID=A0A8T1TMC9_9STRA|nr:hypothetical protein JG687_00019110 [Phytophthora cactorum]